MKGKTVWLVFCYYGWDLSETKVFASKISALKWILKEQRASGYARKGLTYEVDNWEKDATVVKNERVNTDYWIKPTIIER